MIEKLLEYRYYLLILSAIAIVIMYHGSIDKDSIEYKNTDLKCYREMALSAPKLCKTVNFPFANRILAPFVVGTISKNIDLVFRVTMNLSLICIGILFFKFLQHYVGNSLAFWGTLWFILNRYMFGAYAFDFYLLDDSISFIAILSILLCLAKDRLNYIWLIFLIGILTRESMVLVIPTSLAYLYFKKANFKELLIMSLQFVPGVFAFVYLREMNSGNLVNSFASQYWGNIDKFVSIEQVFRKYFNTLLPFGFFMILYLNRIFNLLAKYRHLTIMLIFTYISSIFGNDCERLMLPSVPFLYLMLTEILKDRLQNVSKKFSIGILIIFTLLASLSNIHHLWGILRLPSRGITIFWAIGLSTVAFIIGAILKLYKKKNELSITN